MKKINSGKVRDIKNITKDKYLDAYRILTGKQLDC